MTRIPMSLALIPLAVLSLSACKKTTATSAVDAANSASDTAKMADKTAADAEDAAGDAEEAVKPLSKKARLAVIVETRHEMYEEMGKNMKASARIVKGEVEGPGDMAVYAKVLHESSLRIPELFPEGTGPDAFPETEALPAIWEDPEGFAAATKAYQEESAKLLEVAEAGDVEGFKAQFGNVGKTCGGCHETYRKDD